MTLSQTIHERKWLHSRDCSIANKAKLEVGMNYQNINKYFDYIKMFSEEDVQYKEIRAKQNWKILREKLTLTATIMLQELKDAKIESNRQYLATRSIGVSV